MIQYAGAVVVDRWRRSLLDRPVKPGDPASAGSCHGFTDQLPDAAPEGEGSTKISGKSLSGGCLPAPSAVVGLP
jgi:hypothetical protein